MLARIGGRHLKSAGLINSSVSHFFTQRRGFATKLFVGGLSSDTTEQGLSEAFSKYGEVVKAQIDKDTVSDRSDGVGFVTFASDNEAKKAVKELNGKQLNGRVIFVDFVIRRQIIGGGGFFIDRPPIWPPALAASFPKKKKKPAVAAATATETSKSE